MALEDVTIVDDPRPPEPYSESYLWGYIAGEKAGYSRVWRDGILSASKANSACKEDEGMDSLTKRVEAIVNQLQHIRVQLRHMADASSPMCGFNEASAELDDVIEALIMNNFARDGDK